MINEDVNSVFDTTTQGIFKLFIINKTIRFKLKVNIDKILK